MADATTERKGHSAEQFVESRDYWWHEDFLRACVGRWRLGDAVEVRIPERLERSFQKHLNTDSKTT
jgi:hypothetical protein